MQCEWINLRVLRGSASPMLTANGLVNEKGQFSTPYRIDTPQPITKKLSHVIVGNPYSRAKFGAHPFTGSFWVNGRNITKILIYLFICLFIYLFIPLLETHRQVRPVGMFSRMAAQTTRTRVRMCLFGFR